MDDQVKKEVQLYDFKPLHDELDQLRYFSNILDKVYSTFDIKNDETEKSEENERN